MEYHTRSTNPLSASPGTLWPWELARRPGHPRRRRLLRRGVASARGPASGGWRAPRSRQRRGPA
eukprot:9755349-Alexandrium_andersonii.AAC.1